MFLCARNNSAGSVQEHCLPGWWRTTPGIHKTSILNNFLRQWSWSVLAINKLSLVPEQVSFPPLQWRRHVPNLTLCASVASVCLTGGSATGIRTVRMRPTRAPSCAVSDPGTVGCPGLWGTPFWPLACCQADCPPKAGMDLSWRAASKVLGLVRVLGRLFTA